MFQFYCKKVKTKVDREDCEVYCDEFENCKADGYLLEIDAKHRINSTPIPARALKPSSLKDSKEYQISNELRTFTESRYKDMLSYIDKEEKEKQDHDRTKEKRKKQLARQVNKELSPLEHAKIKGYISDSNYQIEIDKILDSADQQTSKYRDKDKAYIKPFGKTHYTFNSFICLCWYLMKKESRRTDWYCCKRLVKFLTKKEFKKSNNESYTIKDIQQIIDKHKKDPARASIKSYFDFIYSEFCLSYSKILTLPLP